MRRLLIAAGVVVVLAVLAVLAVRQTLGGNRVRAAIEVRLSAMLGQPVSIGRLGIAIAPRVSLVGTAVRVGHASVQAPAWDIARVRILPRLGALWHREVIVDEVDLDGFVVSVLRDDEGRWHLPSFVPAPSGGAGSSVAIQRVRVTNGRVRIVDERRGGPAGENASIDDVTADVAIEAGGLRFAPIAARIGRAKISGEARTDAAAVRLSFAGDAIADGDLPSFLGLIGAERPDFLRLPEPASASVSIRIDRASSRMTGQGLLRAPQVLLDLLRLQRFEAPFAINGTTLLFNPTTFGMYGGTHRGAVTIELADAPPRWSANSRVAAVDVGEFLRALTGRDQHLDGTGSIGSTLHGRVGEPLDRTLRGTAQVTVVKGVVRDFPLLSAINRALRLAEHESGDTKFERLAATLALADGQATTSDLVLDARDVRVQAAGRIGMDRSLDLRGDAVVSAQRVASGVANYPQLARLRNLEGEIDIPLTVSGTLDAPAIGLDVEAAIRKGMVEELRRRIRRLIR